MKKKKKITKKIAYQDNTTAIEKLPYQIVLYPGFYGTFIGFRESDDSQICFCSCMKPAIENYIKFRLDQGVNPFQSITHIRHLIPSTNFPIQYTNSLMESNVPETENIIKNFVFVEGLCHECNQVVPSYSYCHEMYGTAFKQNFGWYIKKHGYHLGIEISPFGQITINTKICPDEVIQMIDEEPIYISKKYPEILHFASEDPKLSRMIGNYVENSARVGFGHKKIGESWTNETILSQIIKSNYPNYTIHRHYRPDFLSGLELDVFIEEYNIGIEYQGIQHFQPIKHWGGTEAHEKLKNRDKQKKELCKRNGITLIYFYYNEKICEEIVIERLNNAINKNSKIRL
ncbi:MAG: hypothetical protein PHV39_08595 [Methanomicrobium sp.]|nr:hypothetical protein [Methanomicrobium sp.]